MVWTIRHPLASFTQRSLMRHLHSSNMALQLLERSYSEPTTTSRPHGRPLRRGISIFLRTRNYGLFKRDPWPMLSTGRLHPLPSVTSPAWGRRRKLLFMPIRSVRKAAWLYALHRFVTNGRRGLGHGQPYTPGRQSRSSQRLGAVYRRRP